MAPGIIAADGATPPATPDHPGAVAFRRRFIASIYRFDAVQVTTVEVVRRPGRLEVTAGPLRADLTIGRRERQKWYSTGHQSGDPKSCNTFDTGDLG